jgi:hypothetical protein
MTKPVFQRHSAKVDTALIDEIRFLGPERERVGRLTVTTESMLPKLKKLDEVLTIALNPAQYKQAMHKPVALSLEGRPQQFIFGRLRYANEKTIRVDFDNAKFAGLVIDRVEITYFGEIRTLTNGQLL